MKFRTFTILASLLITASIAWAGQAITFPPVYEENGINLPLRASVTKRVVFVRALTAGIYFADGKTADDFLKDVPKRIEMTFLVHIHTDSRAISIRR